MAVQYWSIRWKRGRRAWAFIPLSRYVWGNSTWSPLTAVQQGSHGSTEWMAANWMRDEKDSSFKSAMPSIVCLCFRPTFCLLHVLQSPSPHRDSLFRRLSEIAKIITNEKLVWHQRKCADLCKKKKRGETSRIFITTQKDTVHVWGLEWH